MAAKTTSAGYRLPVTSEYHHQCIAQPVKIIRETAERAGHGKAYSQGEYRKCNVVAQENIWKEHVHKEITTTKDWGKGWGFLLEYDFEGNPRQRKYLPEDQSFYKSCYPVTTSDQLGKWIERPQSKEMSRLEKMMGHKRRKTDLKDYDTN